jgi:hypothetical protein
MCPLQAISSGHEENFNLLECLILKQIAPLILEEDVWELLFLIRVYGWICLKLIM